MTALENEIDNPLDSGMIPWFKIESNKADVRHDAQMHRFDCMQLHQSLWCPQHLEGGCAPLEKNAHENDIQLATLEPDGDLVLSALQNGKMVAIFSGHEIMYIFRQAGNYLCYIHGLDAEEGRAKAFPGDETHRAIIKNLATLGEQLFEVEYHPGMDRMEIMFTAEQGIVQYLDVTGKLPIDDVDFMAAYESDASDSSD